MGKNERKGKYVFKKLKEKIPKKTEKSRNKKQEKINIIMKKNHI